MTVVAPKKEENNRIMDIKNLIDKKSVVFSDNNHKNEVLDILISKAVELGFITDRPLFESAITSREALSSTAIGDEIAIPHAKIPSIDSFFVIAALIRSGVDWDALDQKPVKIVFLIGGPNNENAAYLSLLGSILKEVKTDEKKELFLASKNAEDIVHIFTK